MGVKDLSLKLNSLGSGECREHYRNALRSFIEPFINDLSETSQKRLETNPLRILDTKDPKEQELLKDAPSISDHWTQDDKDHFSQVQNFLKAVNIPFELDERMVRGLDYYTRTTFEFIAGGLGAQDAICGGGRYDGLVEKLGGKPTPGIGFAAGIERILLSMDTEESNKNENSIYLIDLTNDGTNTLKLAADLRNVGCKVTIDTLRRSLKAQLRDANRTNAGKVVIIGEEESKKNTAQVKDLSTGEQEEIFQKDLKKYFTV